mmetsp:Transcript_17442/g.55807  ORF Transcript_17442/g.55807 Transcript_17442/m.55807 type:complete len:551 (+) Transcript_17442:77-1729(+)
MGAASSFLRRCSGSKVSQTAVSAINGYDDYDPGFDPTVGFNAKAAEEYGWGGNPSGESRTEDDEFRVMRVSGLSGQVTLYVAGGKHKKPVQYTADRMCPRAEDQPEHSERCPFCPGNEGKTPLSVLCFDADGVEEAAGDTSSCWSVRAFPNIFPMMICPVAFYGAAHQEVLAKIPHSCVASGLHSNHKVNCEVENPSNLQVDAIGTSEVVVESPVHNALLALQEPDQILLSLRAVVARCRALRRQPWAKQLLIFKQYGPLSGGSLVHPHTQVVSLPVLPPPLASRLEHCLFHYSSHGRCATCMTCVRPYIRKASGSALPGRTPLTPTAGTPPTPPSLNVPSGEADARASAASRLVHITDHFVVSVSYASSSQYGMTVAPRRHCASFMDATAEELVDLSRVLALLAQALYHGLDDPSYNIFVRTAPTAASVRVRGREVSLDEISSCFHWILEFRPRFPADLGGFEIASGVRVVSGLPEDHAAELRSWVRERIEDGLRPVRSAPPRVTCRAPSKGSHAGRDHSRPGSATPRSHHSESKARTSIGLTQLMLGD